MFSDADPENRKDLCSARRRPARSPPIVSFASGPGPVQSMNRLFGTVAELETEGEISRVGIDVAGTRLTSLVLEAADTAAYLAPGKPVTVLFKESEVSLAVGPEPRVSIRNRLACEVISLETGRILSHVVLGFAGSRLHSLISAQAVRELGLKPGLAVHALVKATEVGLAEGHVRA